MYTLGKQVYSDTTTTVPLRNIMTTLVSMAVCLGIGISFQRFLPRVAAVSIFFEILEFVLNLIIVIFSLKLLQNTVLQEDSGSRFYRNDHFHRRLRDLR